MKFSLFFLLILVGRGVLAQYAIDSLSLESDLTEWYDGKAGRQNTVLQNGEFATLTRKSYSSHAYFENDNWISTNITYCGQNFRDVPAIYNIEEDLLIVKNNLGPSFATFPLELRKEQVSHFQIGAAHFEYINESIGWHQQGFFKVAYRGKSLSLLSKVYKKAEVREGNLHYNQHHHYFLNKDGRYYRFRRLSGLTKLFPEHKREIRQYKKRLSLRKIDNPSNEEKLALLVGYCDNLTQQ